MEWPARAATLGGDHNSFARLSVAVKAATHHALHALPHSVCEGLDGAHLFVTGAGGFFGFWVIRALAQLRQDGIEVKATLQSRNPLAAWARHANLDEVRSDGLNWLALEAGCFAEAQIEPAVTHILHMATSSNAADYAADAFGQVQAMLSSTAGCIALAKRHKAHLHFVSSGAVYGRRKASDGPCAEEQIERFAPDPADPAQAYGNAKRMAEAMLACALDDYTVSRPFAFLGPGLPLDQHFAAGNFLADAAAGRAITVLGDGLPLRSYMHPADLAAWLLASLTIQPRATAINIGSDQAVSIRDLADEIAEAADAPAPKVLGKSTPADPPAYWPSTARAKALGLRCSIARAAAIADGLVYARAIAERSRS